MSMFNCKWPDYDFQYLFDERARNGGQGQLEKKYLLSNYF